jgi:methyltransferase (TIGR00027 family)
MMAAVARAMHLFDHGAQALLVDWLAWPLIGAAAERIAAGTPAVVNEIRRPFMTWFAARTRITEDWLAAQDASQYVLLGAGLDSFAWRQAGDVRVFEVDLAQTQAWKAERVQALGLPVPETLTSVPFDFERPSLTKDLIAAGLEPSGRVLLSWLGVVPYLTRKAILETLRDLPPCHLTVAYVPPQTGWDELARRVGAHFHQQVRELGEPWISLLSPEEMALLLAEGGFKVIEDLGASDVEDRYGLPAIHHERIALARKDTRTPL